MPLFDLVSPKLFGPLAGPNRTYYAELLLLLWEECRRAADYSLLRAEAVSRAEEYFAALAKPVTLDPDGSDPEAAQPTRDPHLLALGFLLRLRRTGWLTEQPGGFEQEPRIAFTPELAPLLDGLDAIVHPPVVTYTGKLYKAWRLLAEIGAEAAPYENVLREVAADLAELNRSLRGLNASIGHYIDRLTRNRTPEQVLELFGQYEEQVVAAAYHRFKTSDNLFNYRSALEEGLDQCETVYLRALALDYARVEGCAPTQAAAAVRELVQQLRDELEQMGELVRQIDRSHLRYRKRAVQRAQFLLLSDRSAPGPRHRPAAGLCPGHPHPGGSVGAGRQPPGPPRAAVACGGVWRRPPVPPGGAAHPRPAGAGGRRQPGPRAAGQRAAAFAGLCPLCCYRGERGRFGTPGTGRRREVAASVLAQENPGDFARIIGLHTYSRSPRRCYEVQPLGVWVQQAGFRFEDFLLTRRKEEQDDD